MGILCNIKRVWDEEAQGYEKIVSIHPADYEIGRDYVGSIGDTTYNMSISIEDALEFYSREELEALGYEV